MDITILPFLISHYAAFGSSSGNMTLGPPLSIIYTKHIAPIYIYISPPPPPLPHIGINLHNSYGSLANPDMQ